MKEYQVTLFADNGKYKPISTIIKAEDVCLMDTAAKNKIIHEGIKKICIKKCWRTRDLRNSGYTSARVRVYDKEKIEKQKKERYERIKQEKYSTGEWKKPKGE